MKKNRYNAFSLVSFSMLICIIAIILLTIIIAHKIILNGKIDAIIMESFVYKKAINNKKFILRGDSSYLIGFDWGIKFGVITKPDGSKKYDRIEVLKRNLVEQVIRKAEDGNIKSFTGSEDGIVNGVWGVKDTEAFDVFQDKSFVGNEETFWDDAFFGDKGMFGSNVAAK
jgi:hypothetical protein